MLPFRVFRFKGDFLRRLAPLLLLPALLPHGDSDLPGQSSSAGHAGRIEGSFSINPNGAATYSVPIQVIPGIRGMQPNIALNYNSQAGNGAMGVGWSWSGLPAISRCARTRLLDGKPGSINYDADDRFCLNGKRLINIKGQYGAPGTVYNMEVQSWLEIRSLGTCGTGPCAFEARTRNGGLMKFGSAGGRVSAGDGKHVREWALDYRRDANGNYLTVSYQLDGGLPYPREILYTGNEATGAKPTRRVRFTYEKRPDVRTRAVAGDMLRRSLRLHSVSSGSLNGSVFRSYHMRYNQSPVTGRGRLVSIRECGAAGKCLPPTKFSWADGPRAGATEQVGIRVPFQTGKWGPWIADVNGDGRADITRFCLKDCPRPGIFTVINRAKGFQGPYVTVARTSLWAPVVPIALFFGDVNGDGAADMIFPAKLRGALWLGYYEWAGNRWRWPVVSRYFRRNPKASYQSLDVNGDGRPDILEIVKGSGSTGFTPYFLEPGGFRKGRTTETRVKPGTSFYVTADMNGDGQGDMVHARFKDADAEIRVLLSDGSGFAFTRRSPRVKFKRKGGERELLPLDINGDGKMDLVLHELTNVTSNILVMISRGSSFEIVGRQKLGVADSGAKLIAGDINGDGLADLTYKRKLGPNLDLLQYISNGRDFGGKYAFHKRQFAGGAKTDLLGGDVNGDGRMDLIYTQEAGVGTNLRIWAAPTAIPE